MDVEGWEHPVPSFASGGAERGGHSWSWWRDGAVRAECKRRFCRRKSPVQLEFSSSLGKEPASGHRQGCVPRGRPGQAGSLTRTEAGWRSWELEGL